VNILVDTKEKIIQAAGDLFFTQGYQKTTIKQIGAAAGVQTGSIYHFFKNKAVILEVTGISFFNNHQAVVDAYYKDRKISNAYRYCARTMCMFYSTEYYDNLCEITYEAYRSEQIIHKIASLAAPTNMEWFGNYQPEATLDDFFLRTLAMEGCIYSFLSHKQMGFDTPLRARLRAFFSIALSAYFVPQDVIVEVLTEDSLTTLIEEAEKIFGLLRYKRLAVLD